MRHQMSLVYRSSRRSVEGSVVYIFTVHSSQITVYSFQFSVNSFQFSVYSLHSTVYSLQFAVCSLQYGWSLFLVRWCEDFMDGRCCKSGL